MKNSIALLSVLLFLIIIFSLLSSIFKIYEEYSKNNFNINQTSILIKNVSTILQSIDVNESNFQLIFTKIPISSKDGRFREIIEITPIFNKINLNQYLQKDKINPLIDKFLTNLLEFYEIKDAEYFKSLLLDSLDKDSLERANFTENLNINSKLYSYKQFQKIIDFYSKQIEDNSIYKIPFKNYIYFYPLNTPLICEQIDKTLSQFLNLTQLKCNREKTIDNLDIIPFKYAKTFFIKVSTKQFNMLYDLKQKRIIKIENNPIY